jgi:predicted RNA binding protein with dsRBD fold (UPF0201 family)
MEYYKKIWQDYREKNKTEINKKSAIRQKMIYDTAKKYINKNLGENKMAKQTCLCVKCITEAKNTPAEVNVPINTKELGRIEIWLCVEHYEDYMKKFELKEYE